MKNDAYNFQLTYGLVPRVVAVSVCMFSLTIVFTVVTLAAGFVAGNALSATNCRERGWQAGDEPLKQEARAYLKSMQTP